MNLCDKCETVSHCSKHGCIPLAECIASGQVSAAQVVAHQEAGELPHLPTPWITVLDQMGLPVQVYRGFQMRDYGRTALASQQEEIARLRKVLNIAEHYVSLQNAPWSHEVQKEDLKEVRAALNPNQGEKK